MIGRKPLMIGVPLLGVILPLSAMYGWGRLAPMAVMFFIGWALVGLMPMLMATIPSEVDRAGERGGCDGVGDGYGRGAGGRA